MSLEVAVFHVSVIRHNFHALILQRMVSVETSADWKLEDYSERDFLSVMSLFGFEPMVIKTHTHT